MTDTTFLVLQGIGVPPYSAPGLTQTIAPIDAAKNLQRAIDGTLMDLSSEQFRKFKSTISGTDQQPPAIDGVWPGHTVEVDCISELCYPEYAVPSRNAVPGSEREENGFVFYRPSLQMMVTDFSIQTDEYGAQVGWTMDLEEI